MCKVCFAMLYIIKNQLSFPSFEEYSSNSFFVLEDENDTQYVFSLEIPGFKREEIELSVEDDRLYLKASNKTKKFSERFVTLPNDVDVTNISAKLEDGVLLVTLKKNEEKKPRKIIIT